MIPTTKIHCQRCKEDRADLSLIKYKVRKYKIKEDETSRLYPFWEESRIFIDEHIEDIVICSQCSYPKECSEENLKITSESTVTGYIYLETIEDNYLDSIDLSEYIQMD